ncbi:G-box-binding factor 4-like [Salvia miltiorrhiza]|uniref:G-box-binding factor 4-like n=1 Tax=Salvia miltiorrhiza TaxID=226208 RepID=UPI0025AD3DAE|nr:G-box-binding factor 4-like [Salvia miltiorrhiza]XP_057774030.1 G-box-binding factor 4-like [Salvia miltiorrhiza]
MSPDNSEPPRTGKRSADDVWKEIMAGTQPKKEMMTLEDFLLKAEEAASTGAAAAVKLKEEGGSIGGIFDYMNSVEEGGDARARAKRSFSLSAAPGKAVELRERRMIKNRESAARSRERKQAYEAELESMAVKLEEENDILLKEKAERKKKRLKKLMQSVIPVTDMRRPPRILRRSGSMQW